MSIDLFFLNVPYTRNSEQDCCRNSQICRTTNERRTRSAKEKQGIRLGHLQFRCFCFEEVSGFNTAHGLCEEEGHNNVLALLCLEIIFS